MVNLYEVISLLVVFQVKHWLCDYPLQTTFMLKKGQAKDWVIPLLDHAAIHALFTYVISYVFLAITGGNALYAILFLLLDFIVHFTVDRIKAHPKLGGRFSPDNKYFWWCLGADQMMHHFTHYFIIIMLITL